MSFFEWVILVLVALNTWFNFIVMLNVGSSSLIVPPITGVLQRGDISTTLECILKQIEIFNQKKGSQK